MQAARPVPFATEFTDAGNRAAAVGAALSAANQGHDHLIHAGHARDRSQPLPKKRAPRMAWRPLTPVPETAPVDTDQSTTPTQEAVSDAPSHAEEPEGPMARTRSTSVPSSWTERRHGTSERRNRSTGGNNARNPPAGPWHTGEYFARRDNYAGWDTPTADMPRPTPTPPDQGTPVPTPAHARGRPRHRDTPTPAPPPALRTQPLTRPTHATRDNMRVYAYADHPPNATHHARQDQIPPAYPGPMTETDDADTDPFHGHARQLWHSAHQRCIRHQNRIDGLNSKIARLETNMRTWVRDHHDEITTALARIDEICLEQLHRHLDTAIKHLSTSMIASFDHLRDGIHRKLHELHAVVTPITHAINDDAHSRHEALAHQVHGGFGELTHRLAEVQARIELGFTELKNALTHLMGFRTTESLTHIDERLAGMQAMLQGQLEVQTQTNLCVQQLVDMHQMSYNLTQQTALMVGTLVTPTPSIPRPTPSPTAQPRIIVPPTPPTPELPLTNTTMSPSTRSASRHAGPRTASGERPCAHNGAPPPSFRATPGLGRAVAVGRDGTQRRDGSLLASRGLAKAAAPGRGGEHRRGR